MKKILITGANSFIGDSLNRWLEQWPNEYSIKTIDMIDGSWRNYNFAGYDAIFHVAGIAHVSNKNNMSDLYDKVNRKLAVDVANKAKSEGVSQFIFMSSIIVYGDSRKYKSAINENTLLITNNIYGKSKLDAEKEILLLNDNIFKVVILRPPMIYGKGSKGNYPKLSALAQKVSVFPKIDNVRSILHVDNLCEFTRLMIDNNENGVFFPQNNEHVSTSNLFAAIAKVHNKKIILIPFMKTLIKILSIFIDPLNKIFGSLAYDQEISKYKVDYQVHTFEESILLTEK